ncbi:MAG: sensor histidine kinase [Bacillota bacterium]|nr:sensor histidine kinase [Bacillota bacterium]
MSFRSSWEHLLQACQAAAGTMEYCAAELEGTAEGKGLSRRLYQQAQDLREALSGMGRWQEELERWDGRLSQSFSIVRAQEEERRRLARDIHDGPAQLLANVVLRIDVSQKLLAIDPSRAVSEMEQLKQLLRHSLQDVRKIIFDLRPMALDDLGLLPALRSYLSTASQQHHWTFDMRVQGEERRFPPEMEVALFRIVQEALSNVAKHADAHHVSLTLRFGPQELELHLVDDGVGFDLKKAQGQGGFGLISMRERAELLGGQLQILTRPGEGTTVKAKVPYGKEKEGRPS